MLYWVKNIIHEWNVAKGFTETYFKYLIGAEICGAEPCKGRWEVGDAADDATDRNDQQELDWWLHRNNRCDSDCPYCQLEYWSDQDPRLDGETI